MTARFRRPLRRRMMVSAAVCCSLLLLQKGRGGVFAQGSGGGDDDDGRNLDDDDDGNSAGDDDTTTSSFITTVNSTGAPASSPDDDASSQYPDCPGYASHIRDGYCDSDLNVASCGWDGGDCCLCTCGQGLESSEELPHPCGLIGDGYDCQDPDVPADCEATPSPAASFGYPDCDGYMYNFQNSYCNDDLNNAECGWDGGDCCRCTCREYDNNYNYWYYGYYTDRCGGGIDGYNCLDPEAPTDCDTDSPTPSPAAASGYPGCEGYIFNIGDGYCHSSNNNEECGWDGGDCCPCDLLSDVAIFLQQQAQQQQPNRSDDGMCDTSHNNEECGWDGGDCCSCDCEDSFYDCGETGFNCLDPDSSCYGTSSMYYNSYDDLFDDDAAGEVSEGEYHDDLSDYNSPGYDSGDIVSIGDTDDDIADDDSYYGNREFSGSPSPVAVGVQDIMQGSSGSSWSDTEMVGVFVLSVSAFVLFGCAALAACGFLRPRWCCRGPADKESASAAAASSTSRGWLRSRLTSFKVQQGPPTPRAAGDVEDRASVDQPSAGRLQAGIAGAQESKETEGVELGRVFYSTGRTGASQAESAERGDEGVATGDDNDSISWVSRDGEGDTITPSVTVAGNCEGAAAEETEQEGEEGHVIGGGEVPEGGKDASAPAVAGAGSGGDDAPEETEEERDGEGNVVEEDEVKQVTDAVGAVEAGGPHHGAAEEEEQHGGAAVEEDGRNTGAPAGAGGGSGDDDATGAAEEERDVEGSVA
eukprot:g19917.t2